MEFKKQLTFTESLQMIDEVYETVFDTDEETGVITYMPELYDFAWRLAIAKYYGGFSVTEDVDLNYETAMSININVATIDENQLFGIEDAIHEKIEMKKAEINKSNIIVTSQFDDLVPAIQNLIDAVSDKISEFNTEKINNMAETLSAMDMDTLIKTYTNTEFAKNKRNEVLDAKNDKIRSLEDELKKRDKN